MQSNKEKSNMQKMTRNFVSISFALALCVGISGMAFAQEAEEPAEPTVEERLAALEGKKGWTTPSATNGTFSIGVQTVYDGFLVTTPFKVKNAQGEWERPDTNITENDDADYVAAISIAAAYDNSDRPGVGYSFGATGGVRRVLNNTGAGVAYFDNPYGQLFFFNKQLKLRTGGLEELWKAWDDNWDYGNFDGGVQLSINPTALPGLNVGVSLPIRVDADKIDYPFKNLVTGFKLGGLIPYTTISAALKLKEVGPDPSTKVIDTKTTNVTWYTDENGTITKHTGKYVENVTEPVSSMDLTAALDFNLSPIQIRAELQLANFDQDDDDLKTKAPKVGDDRQAKFRFHPRLDISLSKIVDFGAVSLGTLAAWAWIQDDPTYVSDGNQFLFSWEPSWKITDTITASLYLEGKIAGSPLEKEEDLDDYNKFGIYFRPAVAFTIAPNAVIRLRDVITVAEVGIDPKAGLKNQVQVRFAWGF
jgi:hypothetical protein